MEGRCELCGQRDPCERCGSPVLQADTHAHESGEHTFDKVFIKKITANANSFFNKYFNSRKNLLRK